MKESCISTSAVLRLNAPPLCGEGDGMQKAGACVEERDGIGARGVEASNRTWHTIRVLRFTTLAHCGECMPSCCPTRPKTACRACAPLTFSRDRCRGSERTRSTYRRGPHFWRIFDAAVGDPRIAQLEFAIGGSAAAAEAPGLLKGGNGPLMRQTLAACDHGLAQAHLRLKTTVEAASSLGVCVWASMVG